MNRSQGAEYSNVSLMEIVFLSVEQFGCDGASCAPPPVGTGGSRQGAPAGFRDATPDDRKKMRIPPGWTDVYVSESRGGVNGCIAVGYDAKGRRQAIYSARHTAAQAAKKYKRVEALVSKLPKLDAYLERNVDKDDAVAALAIVRATGMRPGSDRNTLADKQAYGASTLQAKHVTLNDDGSVRFRFTGKKGVEIDITSDDPLVRRAVESRMKGKGPDDRLFDTTAADMNKVLDRATGTKKFVVKDLRTVKANAMALDLVAKSPRPKNKKELKSMRKKVAEEVAKQLGNTYSMALNSYINPTVFAPWEMA